MINWEKPKVYAVRHKDLGVVSASRSGGIFTAVSDYVLKNNGVIYGCVIIENFCAAHIRTNDINDRNRMRGSKYIQSKLGDTFKWVKKDLESGYNVLFSGTSCQIAGLKKYLGREYKNLFCVDIVCHGVPSSKVWKVYLQWQEERRQSKIINVDFRDKKRFGWRNHIETLYFQNGKFISSDIFRTLFYSHQILRPSCYECPYKTVLHPGDITIADYWGIEKAAPEFDDNKGVSLVLINNDVGEAIFREVNKDLLWKKTRIEDSMQPPLKAPFPKPTNREEFWEDFLNKSFNYIIKKYTNYGWINKFKSLSGRIKKKLKLKVGE